MRELTYSLGYEATSTLTLKPVDISVPVPTVEKRVDHMAFQGAKVKEHVALIPILRSGLGMVDAMLELLPNAEIHHIGMYKAAGESHPVLYFNRLPKECKVDVAYVLDPCIATSSTVMSVVSILKKVCPWLVMHDIVYHCLVSPWDLGSHIGLTFVHIIVGRQKDSHCDRHRIVNRIETNSRRTSRCLH
jgi:uracil phosphoribosyltransferase